MGTGYVYLTVTELACRRSSEILSKEHLVKVEEMLRVSEFSRSRCWGLPFDSCQLSAEPKSSLTDYRINVYKLRGGRGEGRVPLPF